MKEENLQKVIGLWFDEEKKTPILELENGGIYQGEQIEVDETVFFVFNCVSKSGE